MVTVQKAKQILQIDDNDKDDLITALIELAEQDYQRISGSEDQPAGSELTIIMMVGYLLHQRAQGGIVQSKSMGVLGVQYADNKHGYPLAIINRISRKLEVG